jgi:internalin A
MTNDELLEIIDRAARDGVTELNLSKQGLTTLPPEISQLTNLRELNLSGNQLTRLPDEMSALINLTTLDLYSNRLGHFLFEIDQFSNLKRLDLGDNQLTSLSFEIAPFPKLIPKLAELYLWNNRLTDLPEVVTKLTNLTTLNLYHNKLRYLSPRIAQLTNLTTLDLSFNNLRELSSAIAQLTNLTTLDLNFNDLTSLSEVIPQLTNLRALRLCRHQLKSLPDTIAQLIHLTTLDLSRNELTQLPEAIGQLANLTSLDLSGNQLRSLPSSIRNLSKVKKLDLRGNPELSIPPEILGTKKNNPGDPTTILNYYFQSHTQPNRPLNEAKVLLVGEGDVGKTSLLRQLLHQPFNPQEDKTHGITIARHTIEVNAQPIQLNLWDFGGQEIMHATHQFFLSQRSLYLLVIDCRQSEAQNQLEYWLQIITSFGGDSPIILVGNQCDHQPLDIDQRGLKLKYPNLHAILQTSCKNSQGIDTLNATIIEELSQLSHLHDRLPQTWFTVKEQLEQRTQDFLSRQEYEQVCTQTDILDTQTQTDLLKLLHNLGIVLNFQDDIRLRPEFADTNVLKPDWVTNGVYKILNHNELFTVHRGILDLSLLPNILDSQRYPRDKHSFLISIMQKFELCFALDSHTHDQYLIPGLLPKEEPETGEWQGSLTFQYHYNVLPPSIISRFIVRMNSKISKRTYWRSGVVLKESNNFALIRATLDTLTSFLYDMKSTNLDMERGGTWENCLSELFTIVAQKLKE